MTMLSQIQTTQIPEAVHTAQVIQVIPAIRRLDMAELTVKNPVLCKFYLKNSTVIDVSHIKNADEIEDIANIIRKKSNRTYMNSYLFHKNVIRPFIHLIQDYDNSGLEAYFNKILNAKKIPCGIRKIAVAIRTYLKEKEIGNNLIYNHIIYFKNIYIAPERLGTDKYQSIDCSRITNSVNRELVEKWIVSMLTETDLAIATITNRVRDVIRALNRQELSCTVWTDTDIRTCFDDICSWSIVDVSKRKAIKNITIFFNYLVENRIIRSSCAWLLAEETGIKTQSVYKKTAPNEYILTQLLNAIANADDTVKLSFLLLYCTGMRISELQALKRNCLEVRENATFIRFYQTKMRKEVSNVIPLNLATMIQKYIAKNNVPSEYLFCNSAGKKYYSETLRNHLRSFFKAQNIRNEDGSPYQFKPHSLRHLMAVRMHQYKIPYRYIQEQLHHDTPMMTLFYVEHLDNKRIKKMSDWINSKGQKITPENLALSIHHAQIETAVLPNGLCARPAMLPTCQHCNTCLGCQFFTTAKEWLPTLKQQRDRLIGFIASSKEKGWDKAVINSQRTLEQLNKIINRLEE